MSSIGKAAAAAAAAALLVAGCGSSSASNPSGSAGRPANLLQAALHYTNCMREHGISNFPEPQAINHNGEHGVKIEAVVRASPQSRAAESACRGILPGPSGASSTETAQQLHTRLLDELSFARCMRSHGIARFPDPSPQAQLSVEMVRAHGIDVHSPAVLMVVTACIPASHGALTPAKIKASLSSSGG